LSAANIDQFVRVPDLEELAGEKSDNSFVLPMFVFDRFVLESANIRWVGQRRDVERLLRGRPAR
jgi:hypothetical protein